MPSLGKNLIANFFGKFFTIFLTLIFFPLYVELLGIEAFGIVGFYTNLVVLFGLLDLGLSATLTRELARMSAQAQSAVDMRNMTRTFEVIYWIIALIIGFGVMSVSSYVAGHWLQAKELSTATITKAVCYMGIVLIFQWPFVLYSGGLMGLQKQVTLNVLVVVFATIRWVGVLLVLSYLSASIQAFFIWQIFVNIFQTAFLAFFLWKNLPRAAFPPRFDLVLLIRLKRVAIGMTSISIVTIILMQMDKLILSRMLSLDKFGYYSLATLVVSAIYYLVSIFFSAAFPYLSRLVSLNDQEEIKRTYHVSNQLQSVIVLPSALLIMFFAPEVVFLWTHNLITVHEASSIISLLMAGAIFCSFQTLPSALQLAFGWTKFGFYQYLAGIFVLTPLLVLGTKYFGVLGASCCWAILNFGYFFIAIPLMHRKIMKGEAFRWYFQDIGIPLLAVLSVILPCRFFFPDGKISDVLMVFFLFAILIVSSVIAMLVAPLVRAIFLKMVFKKGSPQKDLSLSNKE